MRFRQATIFIVLALLVGGVGRYCSSAAETKRPGSAKAPAAAPAGKSTSKARLVAAGAMAQVGKTTKYNPSYVKLDYPGGDLPLERGVCTDVVIRALRKVDVDLQSLIHEDMKASFDSYPKLWGLSRPDRNIDHRRAQNIATFMRRKGKTRPITKRAADYLPGDIVIWRLPKGSFHCGVVSTTRVPWTKRYKLVHNIGAGAQLEDVLFDYKITSHFRYFPIGRSDKEKTTTPAKSAAPQGR